ncbi:MAG: hypothetical protein QF733_06015 [Phycisphaerales bacterium]|nr:hypothetical protein [Phycisphaerales bacterium]
MQKGTPVRFDTHLVGSARGYGELAASAGCTRQEREELCRIDIGQPGGGRAERLERELAVLCRPLGTGRIALTRCVGGPADDAGRSTIQFRTLLMTVDEWTSQVRMTLRVLLPSQEVWQSPAFQRGQPLTVPPLRAVPVEATRASWILGGLMVSTPRPVLLHASEASEAAVLTLLSAASDADAARLSWGLGLGRAIRTLDVATLGAGASVMNLPVQDLNAVSQEAYGRSTSYSIPNLTPGAGPPPEVASQPPAVAETPPSRRMWWLGGAAVLLVACVLVAVLSLPGASSPAAAIPAADRGGEEAGLDGPGPHGPEEAPSPADQQASPQSAPHRHGPKHMSSQTPAATPSEPSPEPPEGQADAADGEPASSDGPAIPPEDQAAPPPQPGAASWMDPDARPQRQAEAMASLREALFAALVTRAGDDWPERDELRATMSIKAVLGDLGDAHSVDLIEAASARMPEIVHELWSIQTADRVLNDMRDLLRASQPAPFDTWASEDASRKWAQQARGQGGFEARRKERRAHLNEASQDLRAVDQIVTKLREEYWETKPHELKRKLEMLPELLAQIQDTGSRRFDRSRTDQQVLERERDAPGVTDAHKHDLKTKIDRLQAEQGRLRAMLDQVEMMLDAYDPWPADALSDDWDFAEERRSLHAAIKALDAAANQEGAGP